MLLVGISANMKEYMSNLEQETVYNCLIRRWQNISCHILVCIMRNTGGMEKIDARTWQKAGS